MPASPSAALVLFSGGQDSATCLADALTRYERVETLAFDYGQRHRIELDVRRRFLTALPTILTTATGRLGADHTLNAAVLRDMGETAMTHDVAISLEASGLPNTFVPGRNLLFLTLAGALAVRRGLGVIVGGMCEADYSGYPDCRLATMRAQEQALRLGLDADIRIDTPLMHLTKAETWQLAFDRGGEALIDLICEDTHTCYLGQRGQRQAWGYGCGACPACTLRKSGWEHWQSRLQAAP